MKGSMRWNPGPLVEVSNAPPLRKEREGRERRPARGPPGRGRPRGPASPVIDADVPLLDLVDGREEGGGEEAEGERRDGAQLGHARRSAAAAAAFPGGAARPGAALTSSQRDRPFPPPRRPARGRWSRGRRESAGSRPAAASPHPNPGPEGGCAPLYPQNPTAGGGGESGKAAWRGAPTGLEPGKAPADGSPLH